MSDQSLLSELDYPAPGRYLVAVSGGVDSVVLLDWLADSGCQLVVAHFDHGLRPESGADAHFVGRLAKKYGFEFQLQTGQLPAHANEALSRQARYQFLSRVRLETQSQAIITAHHQDDLLETMILNLQRQTGRRGLTSLRSHDQLQRPLLTVPKSVLLATAKDRGLDWVEDKSNTDPRFRRNQIRAKIMPKLDASSRQRLIEIHQQMCRVNDQFDRQLADYLKHVSYRRQGQVYSRDWFNRLPQPLAAEVVHYWLAGLVGVWGRRRQITYLVSQLRSLSAGKRLSLTADQFVDLTKRSIRLGSSPIGWPKTDLVSNKTIRVI